MSDPAHPQPVPICRWEFQEASGQPRRSSGRQDYELIEQAGPIASVLDHPRGGGRHSAEIREGQWFHLARAACPALNLHGPSQVSVVAWVKRAPKSYKQCQAVAGMWNESGATRQYCLFLDLTIWESDDSVCGHLSATGQPSPGYEYCMEAGIGARKISLGEWHQVAFTFDGHWVRVYLDGQLDSRPGLSPYFWPRQINTVGPQGSDFTVGAVSRWGEMGNFFVGRLAELAIYDVALSAADIARRHTAKSC